MLSLRGLCKLMVLLSIWGCSGKDGSTEKDRLGKNGRDLPDELRMVRMETGNIVADWSRYREIKNKATDLKLLGADVNVTIGELNYTSTGSFKVKSGEFVILGEDWMGGLFVMDLTSAYTLTKNDSGELMLDIPSYLDTERYPEGLLEFHVEGSQADSLNLGCLITLNGKTYPVEGVCTLPVFNDTTIESFYLRVDVPALEWGLYDPDEEQEISKDNFRIEVKTIQSYGQNTE